MPDDEFDRIVEGLELDFDLSSADKAFTDEATTAQREPYVPEPAPQSELDDEIDEPDDEVPFYRQAPPAVIVPRTRGRMFAWLAVLGGPILLALGVLDVLWLPRVIVAALSVTFVAAAIYLILQLPSHGPSQRDWPDDGAVL